MGSGSEESEEETACLTKLPAGRPKRAHQHQHHKDPRGPVPDPGPADGLPAALAVAESSFAARRCVSSAPKKSTRFHIAMFVCCKGLWPSVARSCLAG